MKFIEKVQVVASLAIVIGVGLLLVAGLLFFTLEEPYKQDTPIYCSNCNISKGDFNERKYDFADSRYPEHGEKIERLKRELEAAKTWSVKDLEPFEVIK